MAESKTMTKGGAKTAYNRAMYGTAIPNVKDIRGFEVGQKKREMYQAAIDAGVSEEDAKAQVEGSGLGSVTPRLDRSAYEETQRQERLADKAASAPPVKKDMRVEQLIRKFKGQAPLAETPQQFASQIETSKGFGQQSALLTPAGVSRAKESAIAAGLSPTEAQSQIDAAASYLKTTRDKARSITKGLMESPTPEYGIGVFKPADKAATPVADKPYKFQGPPSPRAPKSLVIPSQTVEKEQETSSSFPIAGAANVIGKAATTGVGGIGSNVTKATNALTQASLPRLGSGATTAAQDSAAVLNKAKDVARANLALKEASIVSKLAGPASGVGKALGSLGALAGKANKLKEVYQTVRFFGDKDYQDKTIKEMSDFGGRGSKAFGSEGAE